ncbi:MAG: hypothetical protein ACLUHC_02065 [Clostridia bacterium]
MKRLKKAIVLRKKHKKFKKEVPDKKEEKINLHRKFPRFITIIITDG